MELRIKDRLVLPMLLPKEGNFMQFNLKKNITSKVDLTEQERQDINLRQNPDSDVVEWDVEKDTPLTVLFSHEEMDYLKLSIEEISDNKLPDYMWSTVEKIYDCIQATEQ